MRWLAILILTLLLLACARAPWRLTLAFTSGMMGGVEPCACPSGPEGGVARAATVLGRLRHAGGPVVALDGGDTLLGTPGADADQGATMLAALGRLGYGAMVAGEREQTMAADTWTTRVREAAMPMLGRDPATCATLVAAGEHQVGILAITRLAGETPPQLWTRLQAAARQLHPRADLMVGMQHAPGLGAREIVAHLPDLGVLYDGHPRGLGKAHLEHGVLVVEGYPFGGKALTKVALEVVAGAVRQHQVTRVVLDARIPDDPAVRAWLGPRQELAARPWPALSLRSLTGLPVFPSSWRGAPGAVIATCWCARCQELVPELAALQARHPRWGIRLMSLLDGAQTAYHVRRLGLQLPVMLDPDARGWKQLGQPSCPHAYVLDAAGQIRGELATAELSGPALEARIAALGAP